MADEAATPCPDAGAGLAEALTLFLGEDAKALLERDGGRYIPPFLVWLDDGEVALGLVAGGRVMASGTLDPAAARELSAALPHYADGAEAEAAARGGDPASRPFGELWSGPARDGWNALSRRTVRALDLDGYKTVADLTAATAADLTDIRNFGAGCLAEAKRVLSAHGLALAGEEAGHA